MRRAGPWGAPGGDDTTGPGPVSAEGPVPTFAPRFLLRIPGGTRLPLAVFPPGAPAGKWGEGARSSRSTRRGLSPVGCAASLGGPKRGGRGGVPGGGGGGCRKATLGRDPASMGGKEGETCRESFSAEPVRLLLKPQHLNQGILIRVYRTRLVKDMCCICRVRGLVVSPFGRYLPIFTPAKQIRC